MTTYAYFVLSLHLNGSSDLETNTSQLCQVYVVCYDTEHFRGVFPDLHLVEEVIGQNILYTTLTLKTENL